MVTAKHGFYHIKVLNSCVLCNKAIYKFLFQRSGRVLIVKGAIVIAQQVILIWKTKEINVSKEAYTALHFSIVDYYTTFA